MSWRDHIDKKKKKNILEDSDNKQNEQKFSRIANMKLPTKEQTERQPVNQQQYMLQNNTNEARNELNKMTQQNQDNRSTWDRIQDKLSNVAYVGKKAGAGILSGVTGLAQGTLTDTANQLKKGEQKSKTQTAIELGRKMLNPSSTNIVEGTMEAVKDNIDILKDKDKNVLQKITGVGTNSVSNAMNVLPFKQQTNATIQAIGSILKDKNTSQKVLDINKTISQPSEELNEQLAQEGQRYGLATQFLGDAMQSVGNMVPSIATTMATGNPTAGLLSMGLSAKGSGTNEALKKGLDLDDAVKRGDTDAMIEVGTEMLTGGVNIFGKGALDDLVQNGVVKNVKNEVGRFLVQQGVNIGGEVLEETISDILGTVLDKGTTDPDANYSWKDWGKTAVTTTLSTVALNILTGGLVGDIRQGQNRNELRNQVDSNDSLTDSQKENLNSKIQDDTITNQQELENETNKLDIIENSGLDEERKASLLRVADKNNLDLDQITSLIEADQERYGIEQNQDTRIENNEVLNQSEQTIQEGQQSSQNETSQQPSEYTTNLMKSIDNYNNSRQEGQEIFDINNEETRKEIESIQKVAEKRGINITFDESRFDNTDTNAFYEYDKDNNVANIVLNPNSTSKKYVQNLVIHEMAHSFEGNKEYNSLSKAILDFAKSKGEYNTAFKDLMKTYSKVYSGENLNKIVEKEAVANILGEKLGDKEFVDSLVNNQYVERSTIQKIIDFAKNQINRFKGYKDQEQYWNHVKTLFEDAYNKSEVSQEGLKQSIETNNKISTKDSQGRELSKGQQEYNKNSKTRDKNGNLIPFYHGTYSDFNVFDKDKINSSGAGAYEGFGFNFTPSKARAETYSNGKVKEVYLNITNPLSFNEKTITLDQLANIIETIDPSGDNVISNYAQETRDYGEPSFVKREALNTAKAIYEYSDSDADIYSQISSSGAEPKSTIKAFEDLGYDGVLHYDENGNIKTAITFEPNQAKNTNNLNPTENDDLRFSKDTTGAWNNFIEKYFKNEGTGTAIKDLKKLPTREYTIQDYEEVINNSANIPEANKEAILKDLEGIELNKQSLNDFKQYVEDLDNNYKEVAQEQEQQRFENKNYKDEGRAELISNKRKEFNTNMEYDDSVVAELDEIIPKNRNGKRTVAEWKNMAKQLGQRIANLSPEQIEDIAVKSYYDLEPTKAITRYDNQSKTNVGYEQLYANDWVNEVYEGVRENRQFSVETENAKEIPNVEIKTKKERQIEKYNKYKKENIKANEQAINNLISFKNNTIRSLEDSINSKQALLDSKKNKNTKVANTLKMQIETLKTKQAELENLYNARIDKFNDKVSKKIEQETQKEMKKTAREVIQQELQPLIENSDKWVDKNKGILYNRETAQRNIEDIIKDKDSADYINETLFNPIQEHQANAIRGAKETFKKIEDLDLNKKKQYTYIEDENGKHIKMPTSTSTTYKVDEATLAQLYLEKKITETDLKEYNVDVNKIKRTATEFKNILDEYYEKMNETVVGYGYAPIGKIENYFPHFTENKPDTLLGKVAGLFGIDTTNNELPTEIAGKTEQFKPGKVWNSNILQRKGNKTDYDALKILDRYVRGAEDIINTTGDIQKLRQFERMLRYKYSEQGIQDRIDSIQESENFTPEEKEEAIHNLLLSRDNQLHHLGHFVTWLEDYTNVLANKKNSGDREFEKEFGRNMYKNMSAIEGRIASNTIGGNLSVSLTNFAPIFQAMGTTKVGNILTGMIQTTRNSLLSMANKNQTDFIENSDFLANRFGADGIAEKTIGQKISSVLSTPMEAVDAFTAETIVRAKYRENLQNGMTEEEALKKADRYAARIMADRSKGALPVIFNNKNPASKLLTMFQVEPNNIVSNYLKDMPRNAKSKAQLTWQTAKLMGASWLFNTMAMAIRGGNEVLPDPIRLVSYLTKYFFGDDDEEKEQAEKDLQESLLSSIPFVQNVAGFLGFEDIGRVPISNAMPDLTKLGLITDKDVSSDYKKQELAKEFSKPLLYLGLPVGGAQLNKTIQGIATIKEGGSYKINKKGEKQLQFPVNNDPVSMIKATVFGKYSLPQAQQYIDSGFKSLNAKQTELYTNTDISFDDLSSYIDYSSSQELKDDKGNIQYTDDNGKLYWYDSKNGKVYSNDYKEISKSINELKKATKKENLVDYINKNMKDLSTDDKWELYKYNIISTTENANGQSQLTRAESLIKNNLTTKEEYMELLDGFIKEGINLPDQKTTDKLLENKISLETYYNYNLDLKKQKEVNKQELKNDLPLSAEEQENKSKVTDKQKYKILQDKKYSNTDKKKIYETFVGTDDSTYNNLKLLTGDVSINAYLDYMQQDIKGEDDTKSDIKGKTKSGTKKNNIASYLQDSGLSNVEQAYIFGKKYSLNDNTNNYYNVLTSQLESIKGKLSEQELRDLYLSLYNVKELENGDLVWK